MNNDFLVQIVGRGEGLVYRDGSRVLHFGVGRSRENHCIFEAYECSDEQFHPVQLSSEDQELIIARIVGHLESRGARVQVMRECPPHPLRSVEEILQERFRERGR